MRRSTACVVVLSLVVVAACAADDGRGPADSGPSAAYVAEIESWQAEREERLAAPTGWLTLVALEWLEPGENTVGAGESADVALPADAVDGPVGSVWLEGGRVDFIPAEGSIATIDGRPLEGPVPLLDDNDPAGPTVVGVGRLSWYVIRRDARHAVRVKDPESPVRTSFEGLDYFPIAPAWRIEAELRPSAEPREVRIPTVVGTDQVYLVPGELTFSIGDRDVTLTPLVSEPGDTELFVMFRDETSGRETYGAGRYLYATLAGDRAIVDFNRAYNPPCAFTPHATCPLPPPENRLALRVEAGEKAPGAY